MGSIPFKSAHAVTPLTVFAKCSGAHFFQCVSVCREPLAGFLLGELVERQLQPFPLFFAELQLLVTW